MRYFFRVMGLSLFSMLMTSCAGGGGGGRAGSEVPAVTKETLPQRQTHNTTVYTTPNVARGDSTISASRSAPIIYDYPGPTRNLNAPVVAAPPVSTAPSRPTPPRVKSPAPESTGSMRNHQVQSGETLWGISKKYGVGVEVIRQANAMTTDIIKPGQVLKIP